MAFPQVVAENSGSETANTTSHTVNLPDGSDVGGQLIVVGMSFDGAAAGLASTWPSGWVKIISDVRGSSAVYGCVAYKILTGSEGYPSTGASITVTTNNSEQSVHRSRLIQGHGSSTSAPEAASATGSSTSPDPPNLTPSWGALDTLWIAAAMHDDGGDSITGFPTNYTNTFADASGGGAGCGLGSGRRELNAASENPGTFTISASEQWVAVTVAIRPGTEGNPPAADLLPALMRVRSGPNQAVQRAAVI